MVSNVPHLFSVNDIGGLAEEYTYDDNCDVNEGAESNATVHFGFERYQEWEIIELILQGCNMEKYVHTFKNFKISLETFLNLVDSDLVTVGITDKTEREIILRNLECHRRNEVDWVVQENHDEDLIIAKNVLQQLTLLEKYAAFVNFNLTSQNLKDYNGDKANSPAQILRTVLEASLVQCDKMCNLIFGENNPDHLIGNILKVHNMSQPTFLTRKLNEQKKGKKKIIKTTVTFVSLALFLMATFKCFNAFRRY